MQALTLKYRPLIFEDILGQKINIKLLSTLIKRGQIGKNIILYGPWGASKTTSSRIYARALNCEHPTEFGSPCNECDSCKLFLDKQYTDYIEVDGATQGGKDKIKDLIQIAQSPPYYGKYRIINIDECHNLTKQAWDTLLKLTEEPPPYLVFIFTTTVFQKVPETIQSRCHNLQVNLLGLDISEEYLKMICGKENYEYEGEALKVLSFLSQGHPRDLIKNLEQVSYFGKITLENTLEIFNLNYIESLKNVLLALFTQDNLGEMLSELNKWSSSPDKIFNLLRSFLLFIFSSKFLGVNLKEHNFFNHIPKEVVEIIYKKVYNLIKEGKLDVNKFFNDIFDNFHQYSIFSQVELYSFMVILYNSIHMFKGSMIQENGKVFSKVPIKKSNKRGREFIETYDKKDVSTGGEKLKPFELLKENFSYKKNSDINITLV